jgi:hypothetical protein
MNDQLMVGDDLGPEWRCGQADPCARRVSSITVASARKVMFAPGQRWQAAWFGDVIVCQPWLP